MNIRNKRRKVNLKEFKLGKIQSPASIPNSYLPNLSIYPRYYQGDQNACGAHAGAYLQTVKLTTSSTSIANLSPRFLWGEIFKIDPACIEEGTTMEDIFQKLEDTGICDLNLCPNNVQLSLTDYAEFPITQEMIDNAQNKITKSHAYLPNYPSSQEIKQAIFQNSAVLLLIHCDDGFFGTTTPTFTKPIYGHFVVAVAYDDNSIYILDSTEIDTNLSVKKIDDQYIDGKINFIVEGGVAIELPPNYVYNQSKIISILQAIISLYQKLISAGGKGKVGKKNKNSNINKIMNTEIRAITGQQIEEVKKFLDALPQISLVNPTAQPQETTEVAQEVPAETAAETEVNPSPAEETTEASTTEETPETTETTETPENTETTETTESVEQTS